MAEIKEKKEQLVLDTSLFTNPAARDAFGPSATAAFHRFLEMAKEIPNVSFHMPPSIHNELIHFVDLEAIPADLQFFLEQKSPRKLELSVPAYVLYELIEDVRRRIDKGLRVAEDAVRKGIEGGGEEAIGDLRRKYKSALREGIIDSREDVDLILLAREIDGMVASADQGVLKFADHLGLRWLDGHSFYEFIAARMSD